MGRIGNTRLVRWIVVGAVAFSTCVLYLPAIHTGYFADDFDFVVRRATHMPLTDVFLKNTDGTAVGGSWRPLTLFGYWASMWPPASATRDHVISLALYAVLVVVVGALVHDVVPDIDALTLFVATALVAFLPLHTEPVVWIAARGDVCAASAGVGAFLLWRRSHYTSAIFLYALSLLAKEMWIFLPIIFFLDWRAKNKTQKKSFAPVVMSILVLCAWVYVRHQITGFGLGGYSVPHIHFGRAELSAIAKEAAAFVVGVGTFGRAQTICVRFAREHVFLVLLPTFIISWAYLRRATAGMRHVWYAAVVTLAPALVLHVPFAQGIANVGEQRYWFAPSIFVIVAIIAWTQRAQHVHARHIYTALGVFLVVFYAYGTHKNISIFEDAAQYREGILMQWGALAHSTSIDSVTLLPDTWGGVHLFAAPFFSRALAWYNLPQPKKTDEWFQVCGEFCATPLHVAQIGDQIFVDGNYTRMFNVHERPRLTHTTLSLPTGTTALWDGTQFLTFYSMGVENTPQK